MHPVNDTIKNSGLGLLYGLTIQTMIYPMELVKLRQQDPLCNQRWYQVAREIYQAEGIQAFYCGLSSKLVETGHKQLWRWPLIMQLPAFLKQRGYDENQQQALTGVTIGTINAFLSSPLDGRKLAAIYKQQKKISWKGFPTYLTKNTIEWSTFLVAQNYFANRQKSENETLNLTQSLIVAFQTSFCVIGAKTPFDVANTLRQTGKSISIKNLTLMELLRQMYRGAPLGFGSLLLYNFSTTLFIDRLKQMQGGL